VETFEIVLDTEPLFLYPFTHEILWPRIHRKGDGLDRPLIATGSNRQKLSRMFCEETGWRKPDGGLKEMSCKVAFLKMHREGRIVLPPPLKSANNHLKKT